MLAAVVGVIALLGCGAEVEPGRDNGGASAPGSELASGAVFELDAPSEEHPGLVSGRFGDVSFKALDFQDGESARARFALSGGDEQSDTIYVHVESPERAVLHAGGLAIDGFGAPTEAEAEVLAALAAGPMGEALARIPLELGCAPTEYERATMQALLFPWQLLLKYRAADPAERARTLAAEAGCNYFPGLISAEDGGAPGPDSTVDNLLLSREERFPAVYGYAPLDAEGAAEQAPDPSEIRTTQQGLVACGFGPGGSGCRGSCGADCTSNNCQERKVPATVCGQTVNLTVFTCGVHAGCIEHDRCFDACDRDFLGRAVDNFDCHRRCDAAAINEHGICNTAAWARGFGPHTHVADFIYHDRCGQTPCIDEALEEYGKRRIRTNGDPHLKTADGVAYDFHGKGEFIAVESTEEPGFVVQVRQSPTGQSRCPGSVAYNRAVATQIAGRRVAIYADRRPALVVDGTPTVIPQRILPLGDGTVISQTDDGYTLLWATGEQVEVKQSASHLNVYVDLPEARAGQYRGLLGTFNDNPDDDITLRDGTVVPEPVEWTYLHGPYAESWRVSREESLFDYGPEESFETFNDPGHPTRPASEYLTAQQRDEARVICEEAGVTDAIVMDNCIVDVGCTGDPIYADSHATAVAPERALDVLEPVFLDGWAVQGDPGNGNWTVAEDGRSVRQSANGQPTFFVSPNDYFERTLTGTLAVDAGDDDYIGFVFGYQAPIGENGDEPVDFKTFVLSWKRGRQGSGGYTAEEGLTLGYLEGRVEETADVQKYFWGHTDDATYRVLGTDWGDERGWRRNTVHDFALTYTRDKIVVAIDGQLVFDVDATEAGVPFEAGRFGFYNYSQPGVRYADFAARSPRLDLVERGFTFGSFDDASSLSLLEDASLVDGRLRMTNSERSQLGAAWHRGKPQVTRGFETSFRFQMSDPVEYAGQDGGHGLVFVIQNAPDGLDAVGRQGVGLGYETLPNSLAVEFDTYLDSASAAEGDGNHVSIQTRGTAPNDVDASASLAQSSEGLADFLDGAVHSARIVYDAEAGRLRVFVDGAGEPVVEAPVDLEALLELQGGQAYVGFTATTGVATATHEVLEWSFQTR